MKKIIWSESGEKSAQLKRHLQMKALKELCYEDNRGWTFSLDEALLWIMDSYFGVLMWKCDD